MRIMAIDPGGTTGYFMADVSKDVTIDPIAGQVIQEKIWDILEGYKPEAIVLERFTFRGGRTKVDFGPAEAIGIIKEWARQHEVEIYLQTPSQAKHYWNDNRMKEKNTYFSGMPHATDAARHFWYFKEFGAGKNAM